MATTKKPAAKAAPKSAPADDSQEDTTVKPHGGAIIDWEEQMAADAALSQKMEESTSTGAFFGTKGGVLTWNDADVANNQIACVIVDSILENVSYDAAFDDDQPAPPRCFAFARLEQDLAPHENVVARDQQCNDTCDGCERNKFGSADVGRGKACSNKRRLALVPAGTLDANGKFTQEKSAEAFQSAAMGFLKVPVTSVRAYSAYVKQMAGSLKRPPHGIFTKIKIVPDKKNQFAMTFECLGLVPNPLMSVVMGRHKEAEGSIMQPYNLDQDEAPAKPAAKGRQTGGTRANPRAAAGAKTAGKRKF